ncbi:argininosuccinate lyase, partial [Candidatus Geothermarchaeota archaeon]
LSLLKAGWVNDRSCKKILNALLKAKKELKLNYKLEDIHLCLESYVIKEAGREGGFLSLGRSRNDQVAAAIRLELRNEILHLLEDMISFVKVLLDKAKEYNRSIMPAYTHLQPAQPTTVGHWLLSYVDAFFRDIERLQEAFERTNKSPLGSAALVGSRACIDRKFVATLLGFEGIVENTMDAISSRDFVLDALHALSSLMLNISKLSQDIIHMSCQEVGYLHVPDEYVSTSSIMPQKRNVVVAETARALSSIVISNLTAVYGVLKGLNQGYNLDFQEITWVLWQSMDKVSLTIRVFKNMIRGLKFNEEKMKKIVDEGFTTATDLAEYLSIKLRMPFRDIYRAVGKAVAKARKERSDFKEKLVREILRYLSTSFRRESVELTYNTLYRITDPLLSLKEKKTTGGPNPKEVLRMINDRKRRLEKTKKWINGKRKIIEEGERLLKLEVRRVMEVVDK